MRWASIVRALMIAFGSVGVGWCDLIHVGTMESASPQSVMDSLVAFANRSTFDLNTIDAQKYVAQFLKMPTLDGADLKGPLRGYMLTDPKILTNAFDFIFLNELPISKEGTPIERALANNYGREGVVEGITCMANPLNAMAPTALYCLVTNQRAWVSVSFDAVRWAQVSGLINSNPPPARPAGEIAVELDPLKCQKAYPQVFQSLFAPWCETKNPQSAPKPLQAKLAISGMGVRLATTVFPCADSAWATMAQRDPAAVDALMRYVPEHAFASFFYGENVMAKDVLARTGLFLTDLPLLKERVVYLAPTKNNQGFVLVQIARLTERADLPKICMLLDGASVGSQLILKRIAARKEGTQEIERFSFAERTGAATQSNAGFLEQGIEFVTPLFRQGVLEVMVKDGLLIWAVASESSVRTEMMFLPGAAAVKTVAQRIQAQNETLQGQPVAGFELSAVALFRHLVSILPGSKPEHVRLFPVNNYPAYGGMVVDASGRVMIGGFVHPAEIAALLRVNRDGREVLQELLFMMMTLQLQRPAEPQKEKAK